MASISDQRIVVLIDMDCFFCQVETKLQPEYIGKPLAVVQYNQWQLGGIIAVNYEAREFGVTRHMRGQEAKEKCPELILASVPCLRGKADTSRYRSAGREVINVISKHCSVIERASVDEAYLDITNLVKERMATMSFSPKTLQAKLESTYVVGFSTVGKNDETERRNGLNTWLSDAYYELQDTHSQRLAIAAIIVEELRADIFEKTGFKCSAGISQNKILAKLACGLHKPNQQTILPPAAVPNLYSTLPVKQVRNLGGKFGDVVVESLRCNVMSDLLQYSLQYLQKRFDEKTGLWLYNIARGIDNEPVTTRLVSKSIGACKKFPGKQAIVTLDVLKHWSGELAEEVCERLEQDLEENERRATLLTVCFHFYQNRNTITQSRSCPLTSYKPEKMANLCTDIITKSTGCPIAYIGISVGKFVPSKGSSTFMNFFKNNIEDSESQLDKNHVVSLNNQRKSESIGILNTQMDDYETTNQVLKAQVNVEAVKKKTVEKLSSLPVGDNVNHKSVIVQDVKLIDNEFSMPNSENKREESPTSRKLNKLVKKLDKLERIKDEYCNKMQTINDKHFTDFRVSSAQHELNNRNFEKSFFMNIFKENQSATVKNVKNMQKNIFEQQSPEDESKSVCNYKKCDADENEVVLEKSVSASAAPNDTDSTHSYKDSTTIGSENVSVQSDGIDSTKQQLEEERAYSNAPSTVRLVEIFPNLNDIDPSIIPLLPKDLQAEAKSYLNTRKNLNRKLAVANSLSSKARTVSKSTNNTPKKRKNVAGPISNFLIKRPSDDTEAGPVKMCTECNRLIPVTQYDEHSDFHVAQNLHNRLNGSLSSNTGVKRKHDVFDTIVTPAKRSTIVFDKSEKCSEMITFPS